MELFTAAALVSGYSISVSASDSFIYFRLLPISSDKPELGSRLSDPENQHAV